MLIGDFKRETLLFPSDNFFVHEWAQFRYGLHEEYGFPGDARYPAFRIGGSEELGYKMLANACTNERLVYSQLYVTKCSIIAHMDKGCEY